LPLRVVLTHVYAWPEVRRGGERYLHGLAGALSRAGHDVSILSTAPQPGRSTIDGVDVRYLRRRHLARRKFGPLADEAAFGAEALLRLAGARVDVWHAMGTADAAAATAVARVRPGVRSVYTDHGFPNPTSRQRRGDRRLHRFVVDHVDAYVCVSEAAGGFLREGYGRDPVVLSGGVDLAGFVPAPQREAVPVLLFAGDAAEDRKNLPLLVDAYVVLRRTRPDLRLWVVGPGDQAAAVAHVPDAARAGIDLLGSLDPSAMAARYARAWVTVLPAFAEAFGLVLVESLACGTPVVALAAGGGPADIVTPGTGVLAEATAEGLASACGEALDLAADRDTVERCREASRSWDWDTAIVPRLEEVYAGG
jgi:glycosyltransferase involved in cell wall biosynthesis